MQPGLAPSSSDDDVQERPRAIAGVLIAEPAKRVEVSEIEVRVLRHSAASSIRDAGADGSSRRMIASASRRCRPVESMFPAAGTCAISVFTGTFGWGAVARSEALPRRYGASSLC